MNSSADIEMNLSTTDRVGVVNHLHMEHKDADILDIDSHLSKPSTKTLYELAEERKDLRFFISLTGNYWQEEGVSAFARFNFVISKLGVLTCAGLLLVDMSFYIQFGVGVYHNLAYYGILIVLCFVLFLATLSVLPAQHFNWLRLKEIAQPEDLLVVSECLRLSLIYGLVSLFFVCVGIVLESIVIDVVYIVTALVSAYVLLSLMFNLFFLLLDLKVSLLLLDQLHLLADNKMLTIERFIMVRAEIHRRVQASRWACDFILFPAVASIVGIVISILIIDNAIKHSKHSDLHFDDAAYTAHYVEGIEQYTGLVLIQLKELFFVAVAFWYVAKVNARADELTLKLSQTVWGNYQSINNAQHNLDRAEHGKEERIEQMVNDMQRVSVYMSANSRPISFTLLFKRVTWKTVVVSVIGFVVTLLVGIIKNIATQAAS